MVSDRHERRVLGKASNGDAKAFVRLGYRYADALYRYLYFRLGSVVEAEEVCARVFVRAWETLPTDPRLRAVPFAGWLFQVADDVVGERNERFGRLGLHPSRPPLVAWAGKAQKQKPSQLHPRFLAQALMQMDSASQQVILLRFVVRMSHRETGLVIGDTGTGSRVLQYRALLELREILTRKRTTVDAYASENVGTATFCLDRIIAGLSGPEECLTHFSGEADHLEDILDFAVMVREATAIRPRRAFEADLRRQLLVEIRQSQRRPIRQPGILYWLTSASTRIPAPLIAAFLLAVVLLFGATGATGVAQAIDRAGPGDRLYELDLRLERSYRALLSSPDRRIEFALDLMEERLAEAERLADRGDSSGLQVAIVAYSVEVSLLANEPQVGAKPEITESLDRQFSEQQQRLDRILSLALSTSNSNGQATEIDCGELVGEPYAEDAPYHPIGLALATQHSVEYGQVMEWVCSGHSFGEIVLALAAVDAGQFSTSEVLLLKSQLGGWGQLWQEMAAGTLVVPASSGGASGSGTPPTSATGDATQEWSDTNSETPTSPPTAATPSPVPSPQGTAIIAVPPSPDEISGDSQGAGPSGPPDWVNPPGGGPPSDPGPPDWVDPQNDPGPSDWVDPPGGGPPADPGPPAGVDPPGHDDNPGNSDNPGNDGNSGGNNGNGNGGKP